MEGRCLQVWTQKLVRGLQVFMVGHYPHSQIPAAPQTQQRTHVTPEGAPGGSYQALTLELLGVPLQTARLCLGHAKLVLVLRFPPLPLPLSDRDPLSRPFSPGAPLFPPWYLALPEMTLPVRLCMWASVCLSLGLMFVYFCTAIYIYRHHTRHR